MIVHLLCGFIMLLNTQVSASEAVHLDALVKTLNQKAKTEKLALKELNAVELQRWFEDAARWRLSKTERLAATHYLKAARLPPGWTVSIEQNEPARIVAGFGRFQSTVVRAGKFELYSESVRENCPAELCWEPFIGKLSARASNPDLLRNVPLAITEVHASGDPNVRRALRDALWVQIRLNRKNLNEIASYFSWGGGANTPPLKKYLEGRLGAHSQVWIDLHDTFRNWVTPKVNTFAVAGDHTGPYAVVREFFRDNQSSSSLAQATQAAPFEAMLSRYYCAVPEREEPRFGDIISVPGVHAARYILKDPVSARGIVMSLHDSPAMPYRFWWAEEDFGLDKDWRSRVDVWRRCRN